MPQPETPAREPQSTGAVLMVRPARFGFNPQTAASNAFQSDTAGDPGSGWQAGTAQELAVREFDRLAASLSRAGVAVLVAEDTPSPPKPDAVFPNNWVSFHHDGTVVLYPMLAPNRRCERRDDVLRQVIREGGFHAVRTIDLTYREAEGKFLEGTGSMVLDRANRVAYAALSPRTDLEVLGDFSRQLGYELLTFEALDAASKPIYHTNVLLAIGAGFAVLCAEALSAKQRVPVVERLRAGGHEVVQISRMQMQQFAGNVLELAPAAGRVVAMSTTAWRSFEPAQRRLIERHGSVVAADIPVIETVGGGGVRCMLAEIHLPKQPITGVTA